MKKRCLMPSSTIKKWVQEQRKQGYDDTSISNALSKTGYSKEEIDQAISTAKSLPCFDVRSFLRSIGAVYIILFFLSTAFVSLMFTLDTSNESWMHMIYHFVLLGVCISFFPILAGVI